MLIGEVIGLFLGDPFDPNNGDQVLNTGFMLTLQTIIKTKLDRKKLDKETTFIQNKDSAGVHLNGVNHIYVRINLTKEQQQTNTDKLPEGVDDVIDEVMEYEPEMLVPNMDISSPGTNSYFKYEFVPAMPVTAVGKT